jgi:hypothetical protein
VPKVEVGGEPNVGHHQIIKQCSPEWTVRQSRCGAV